MEMKRKILWKSEMILIITRQVDNWNPKHPPFTYIKQNIFYSKPNNNVRTTFWGFCKIFILNKWLCPGLLFYCLHVRINLRNVNYISDRYFSFGNGTLRLCICRISEGKVNIFFPPIIRLKVSFILWTQKKMFASWWVQDFSLTVSGTCKTEILFESFLHFLLWIKLVSVSGLSENLF